MMMPEWFSGVAKTAVISLAVGVCGWVGHSYLATGTNTMLLAEHTSQLSNLWVGQKETHDTLQTMAIGITEIKGSLNTLNQKVDDDIVIASANAQIAAANGKIAVATAKDAKQQIAKNEAARKADTK